jgi:hypothetical protein
MQVYVLGTIFSSHAYNRYTVVESKLGEWSSSVTVMVDRGPTMTRIGSSIKQKNNYKSYRIKYLGHNAGEVTGCRRRPKTTT